MTMPFNAPLLDTFANTGTDGDADSLFEDREESGLSGIISTGDAGAASAQGAQGAQGAQRTATTADDTAPIPGGGALLQEPSAAKVYKAIDKAVLRQERLAKNREQIGKHWDRVRRGVQFSILEKAEDQDVYQAVLPPGIEDVQQPIPNKVLDLSDKQVSQILVDPPLPNPKPDGDAERNRGAMDLAGRFLRADGDVSGTNDAELWRELLTMNRTRGSAFVFVWVDPTAGGWRPKQKLAHPNATDPANPLMGPATDPATGNPAVGPGGQPVLERTSDPVLRYVAEVEHPDDPSLPPVEQFTEHASEAAREWLPKHRRMVLYPNQVRTTPPTATASQARAITLLMWEPLGEARRRFSVLDGLGQVELLALTQWRPKRWKTIVPDAQRPQNDGLDADGSVSDDTLLFWYHHFCRIGPDYVDGAEVAVNGATVANQQGFILRRDTLREDIELEDGTTAPVLMEPPVAQFRAMLDVEYGDPFGARTPPVSRYGGANETRAHLYLATLEDIDLRLHVNTFLVGESTVTREQLSRRDGTPIDVLTKDHMPTFEQRPPLPGFVPTMLDRVEHDMDSAANLNQTAQSLDSSYSISGEAKKVALRQAKVQLAQDWQGFINGFLQYMKVKLQLAQARLKTPQLIRVSGQDSAYKSRHFVGADLIGVSAVSLLPGSGTMMSAAEKMQYLSTAQSQAWLDKDEAGQLFRAGMSDDLGLPPSPHEEHIDRCIADWIEGPPAGWEDAYHAAQAYPQQQQAYAANLQQLVATFTARGVPAPQAQAAAQQQAGPPPAPPAPLYTPFEPRPNDEEPVVAKIQYEKLSALISTTEYRKQSLAWRSCVDKKYEQATYAAGIQTVRQQQAAQTQTAQAAQPSLAKVQPPPTWPQFLAAIERNAIALAEQAVAKEVAAGGAPPTAEGAGGQPEPGGPEPTHPLDLAHEAKEASRDRQHELALESAKHANAMQQLGAKAATTLIGQKLAADARRADRAEGEPLPDTASTAE